MIAEAGVTKKVRGKRKVLDSLVCEILDGKPLYYKGYKDVLLKRKTIEEIMGSSSLQAFIISFLMEVIIKGKLSESYQVMVSEPGLHIDSKNNVLGDILIYDKQILTPDKINAKYLSVPAKVHMEVDISIELEDLKDYQYVEKKINKLHAFKTEKVIWILTNIRKVMVAVPGNPWQMYDWQNDIELLDSVNFNIGKYLDEKGVVLPTID
jgi:hypothetical protein